MSAAHACAQRWGSLPAPAKPVGNGIWATASFPIASSAPLPTWALQSITLPCFQGVLSSLSKVTHALTQSPLCLLQHETTTTPGAPFPPHHIQTATVTLGPPNLFGEWVSVQRVASLVLGETAKTTIPRPDLNFTKSPGSPYSPPLGQKHSTRAGNHHGMRVMEKQRFSSHQPSGTETPVMTCPRANIGGKWGIGRGRSLLSFPCHPLPDSCQAGGTFSCVSDVSFAPLPSITPRASLPLGVDPIPGAGGRELTCQMRLPGTAGSGRGWSVRSPGPWLCMLRQPSQPRRRRARFSVLARSGDSRRAQLAAVTEPDAARRGVREGRTERGRR